MDGLGARIPAERIHAALSNNGGVVKLAIDDLEYIYGVIPAETIAEMIREVLIPSDGPYINRQDIDHACEQFHSIDEMINFLHDLHPSASREYIAENIVYILGRFEEIDEPYTYIPLSVINEAQTHFQNMADRISYVRLYHPDASPEYIRTLINRAPAPIVQRDMVEESIGDVASSHIPEELISEAIEHCDSDILRAIEYVKVFHPEASSEYIEDRINYNQKGFSKKKIYEEDMEKACRCEDFEDGVKYLMSVYKRMAERKIRKALANYF